MNETEIQMLRRRAAALRNTRSRFEPHWKLLDEHLQVRRARWCLADQNNGRLINDTIINNTPVRAARVFISGMMAALTSPARVWYLLAPPDPEMAEYAPVREYLHICQERMRWVYAKSNWYRSLGDGVYADLVVFGTNATLVEEDARNVVRFQSLPLGEYSLAIDAYGKVDTLTRDIPMTVRQVVQQFCSDGDTSRLSPSARTAWDRSAYDTIIDVVHCVYPNGDFDPRYYDRRGKRFSSDWFEKGAANNSFLRRAGYEEFPALCPRWSVRAGEAYGRSPAMEVLGDCMALQHREVQGATLLDKLVDPPMKASDQLRSLGQSLLPGDTTYLPPGANQVFEPAIKIDPSGITAAERDIMRTQERIERGLFNDLWISFIGNDRNQPPTATEVQAVQQEAMLQLGPALENLEDELLRPSVDRVFSIMARRGLLPPPPPELQGVELKVEFQSVMHQAQRMVSLSGLRTLYTEIGQLAAIGRPEALDKLDADKIVDEIGIVLGTKPDLLLTDDEVAKVRHDRAARQQAMAQGQAMLAAAKGAKDLGQASLSPDNALGGILNQLSPAAAAAGSPPVGSA